MDIHSIELKVKISPQTLQTLQMLQMQLQPKLLILKQENPQVPITVQDHPTPAPAEAVDTVMVDTVVRAVVLKVQTVHHPQAVIQVLHNPQTVLHQISYLPCWNPVLPLPDEAIVFDSSILRQSAQM